MRYTPYLAHEMYLSFYSSGAVCPILIAALSDPNQLNQ
jgi:hypothetical protein